MADTSSVIKQYLLTDVVDSTPAAIMAANPLMFSASGQVPLYMYTSLCTLWTGTSGNVTELSRTIVSDLGAVKTGARRYISLEPVICESADGRNEGLQVDTDGAEDAVLNIFFHISKEIQRNPINPLGQAIPSDYGLIENTELRIRHLLDANLRGHSQRSQDIPIDNSQGLSINPYGYFKCIWKSFGAVGSETELVSQYSVNYFRTVGYAAIP